MSPLRWVVAPAIVTLQQQLDAARPGRRINNLDGTIGDAAHAARESDHNPDDGNPPTVCAVDVHDGPQLDDGELYESLKEAGARNPQLKYAINAGRIYSPEKGEHPYHGLNAHADHCHISVTQEHKNDDRPWYLPGITDPAEDDDMQPADRALLVKISNQLDRLMAERRTDHADTNPRETVLADVLNAVDNRK